MSGKLVVASQNDSSNMCSFGNDEELTNGDRGGTGFFVSCGGFLE